MAFDGDKTNSVRLDGCDYTVAALQSLPKSIGKKYLKPAIAKGMEPVRAALIANTPIGPTGNLHKAADAIVKSYPTGVVFGVVGYKRAVSKTDEKGYHSHFIEFGTNERQPTRAPYLSSFSIKDWQPPGWRGRWPMVARKVDGVRAQHPLGNAFSSTSGQALSIIVSEMRDGLDKAIAEARSKGAI